MYVSINKLSLNPSEPHSLVGGGNATKRFLPTANKPYQEEDQESDQQPWGHHLKIIYRPQPEVILTATI